MSARTTLILGFLGAFSFACVATAQSPAPPSNLHASDTPNDKGQAIDLSWSLSKNDVLGSNSDTSSPVVLYTVQRMTIALIGDDDVPVDEQEWRQISEVAAGESQLTDRRVQRGGTYRYRIAAVDTQGTQSQWVESVETTPTMQIFNKSQAWLAIFILIFGGLVALFIYRARSGKKIWLREIAGLAAIDEAVGRATEMGRPVLFVLGIQDINEIQTLAGLTVLSRVAKTAAEYGAHIEVPTCRSLVMAAARETVESAYLAAGRPDSYQPDRIRYLTDEQFAFVAGVTGYMVREEPAACIYMGGFYAESLILAETGNYIGAIQVAGTAMPAQLPFFVASCDYTLIGEEFFAASAYLSGDPLQMGSLKGQDMGKLVSLIILVLGICIATFASMSGTDGSVWAGPRDYISDYMLGNNGLWPKVIVPDDVTGEGS